MIAILKIYQKIVNCKLGSIFMICSHNFSDQMNFICFDQIVF
jgi:hypothetical protein